MSVNKYGSHEHLENLAGECNELITDEHLIEKLIDLEEQLDSMKYNYKNEFLELGLDKVKNKLDEMLANTKLD